MTVIEKLPDLVPVDDDNDDDDLCHLGVVKTFCGKKQRPRVCMTPVSQAERYCPQCRRELCIVCMDLRWSNLPLRNVREHP